METPDSGFQAPPGTGPRPQCRLWRGAFFSAVFLVLAQPPFDLFPLSVLALVPLTVSLASLPTGPDGSWAATRVGFVFGLLFWGGELIWVPLVVGSFFPWAFPGYLLLLVLLGGLSAVLGWLVHALYRKVGLSLALALPLAWVGVEWLKGHFPFGLAFPWMGLSLTLTSQPELLGLAEWVGEEGVAFWLAGISGLVAAGLLVGRKGRPFRYWLLAGTLTLLLGGIGVVRARTIPLQNGPAIIVLGTGILPELRRAPGPAGEETLRQIQSLLGGERQGGADLLVLPEGTVPSAIGGEESGEVVQALRALALDLHMPIAFGGIGHRDQNGGSETVANSAFLLSPGITQLQQYDKIRLVPGMEAGSYARGEGVQVFSAGDWAYGPIICYESLFGSLARKARLAGSQVLLNLTSDIWFGREGSPMGSLFLRQHPAHLTLRAVETRSSVARAANGGVSFLIDPRGDLVSEVVPPEGGMTRGRVPVYGRTTLFTRTGDWVGPLCLLICGVLLFSPFWGARPGSPRRGQRG